MIFVLIGYRKVSPLWVIVWLATMAMIGATNRGAALAVLLPVVFAMIMLGRVRLMLTTLAVGLSPSVSSLRRRLLSPNSRKPRSRCERPVSAHQIVENAKSILGQSGHQTEGTKNGASTGGT